MDLSDSVPTLVLIWIATLVLAVFRSGARAPNSGLRALSVASWWITNAAWLSIGVVVHHAHYRNLLSLPAAILLIVLSYVALAGANWFIEARYIDAQVRS
jgi:hypothetical protein